MVKSLSVAETVRLVEQALAEAYPEVDFAIEEVTRSTGRDLHVYWTNGPTVVQVHALTTTFEAAFVDPVTNFRGGKEHVHRGEVIVFPVSFILGTRLGDREEHIIPQRSATASEVKLLRTF